ncbi:MAG TPA: UPF0280 family protein [Candidatus Latescibacteria bacterium]|nr:UPF0280 family protein [Candidatus Latescibacterota bacterium]
MSSSESHLSYHADLKGRYEPRTYRDLLSRDDLVLFTVAVGETDLAIRAERELSHQAVLAIRDARRQIERYILRHPEFETSLEPVEVDEDAGTVVLQMAEAGEKAGTGPMAAVAGAIAEHVGERLLESSKEVIVENGGDIFVRSLKERVIGIYAGTSPLSGKIALKISPSSSSLGVCTSSGTVGHSTSFGKADAAVVISRSTPLADAVATATCNNVKGTKDIGKAIDFAMRIEGVLGVVLIIGNRLGVWGEVELTRL